MTRRRRKSPSTPKARATAKKKPAAQTPKQPANPPQARPRRGLLIAAGIAALIVIAAGLLLEFIARAPTVAPDAAKEKLAFVGSETCIGCHAEAGKLWHPSLHAHAMAHATQKTVLGDFDDARFDYDDTTSRFFRKDNKFYVETDGPDGTLQTFEVKYTFGHDP